MNADIQVEKGIQRPPAHKVVSNGDERAKTMVLAYAKDLVVAMMSAGIAPPNPTDEVLGIYRKFMAEIEK